MFSLDVRNSFTTKIYLEDTLTELKQYTFSLRKSHGKSSCRLFYWHENFTHYNDEDCIEALIFKFSMISISRIKLLSWKKSRKWWATPSNTLIFLLQFRYRSLIYTNWYKSWIIFCTHICELIDFLAKLRKRT